MRRHIGRRALLRGLLGGAGVGAGSLLLGARAGGPDRIGPHTAAGRDRARAFASARAERPWLAPWTGVEAEALPRRRLTLEGRLPETLRGTLFRNGPARHELGGFRYRHWFDGDGMVHAWRLDDAGVTHEARMVRTGKYLAETAAGRPLYPAFDTPVDDPAPIAGPDSVNVANISVLPRGEELWALWEAGSPWVLDAATLETRGIHEFSPVTRGLPFSAHPRVEPDGTLWNFGYATGAGRLVFWHVAADGRLLRTSTLPVAPMTMPHDFVVTRRHLVLLLPPLELEPGPAETFLTAYRWRPEHPTRVLVVSKEDLQTHWYAELPAQWVFHFGNGFEDADGILHFDACSAPGPEHLFEDFRGFMDGSIEPDRVPQARSLRYRLDPSRRTARTEPLTPDGVAAEFPVVDPGTIGRPHRSVFVLTAGPGPVHRWYDSVARVDLEDGLVDRFRYPEHEMPEEHVFVPAVDEPDGGWVLGTALDWRDGVTRLRVFRARDLQAGPVATATLPRLLPPGLHGRFAPSLGT